MQRRIIRLVATTASLALVLGAAHVASACPSCQTALGAEEAHGDLARGIYYSILFMMSMPFAIVGAFGGLAYRSIKREQRRRAELALAQHQPADDATPNR
jgi:p-aminobenzoyl-glutamate transporter AbgT